MTDSSETKLIEALQKVETFGDVAPAHVHDPSSMIMRQIAERASLIRWDDEQARYVLTLAGRRRMTARRRAPGLVLRFPTRDEKSETGAFRHGSSAKVGRK